MIHELFMKLYDRKDRHFEAFTFQEGKGVAGISFLKLNERVGAMKSYLKAIETHTSHDL